jgi:NTE family protein
LLAHASATAAKPPSAFASAFTRYWQGLRPTPQPPRLNLALQGGGAHGAFTWGVLDALLEDPRIALEGLSGSSAGAINAVVLADGWLKGGRPGARQALAAFWSELGQQLPMGLLTQGEGEDMGLSPAGQLLAHWAGHFSPAQLNPFDLNPLRELLKRQVDFEALRAGCPFKLFIATTHANTGKLRVFREQQLTLEVLLASACLPRLHRTVEIDGEPYWDGGFSANPAVFPLFYECTSADVLLVLLSPLVRDGVPSSALDIAARATELAFSAHFLREMQMFARASAYARPSFLTRGRLERRLRLMRFHMVHADGLAALQQSGTQLLAHGPYLQLLHSQGRERAQDWLRRHAASIGQRATLDVQQVFA